MKHLFFIAFMALAFGIKAQSISAHAGNSNFKLTSNGTIQQNGTTKGYIKSDGTIENASHATIGYIKSDGTIENGSHSTVGYVKGDGTVENSSHATLGYVKSDYSVENASHASIGKGEAGTGMASTAVAFFFFQ
jgi:hypothetical protein